jgi:hypothetical protein
MRFGRDFSVENNLSDAVAIAKIDEREFTEISALSDPAHEYNFLTEVAGTQITAGMSPFQISQIV